MHNIYVLFIYHVCFVFWGYELHGQWSARRCGQRKTFQPGVVCDEARMAQRVQPRQQLKNHPINHECKPTMKTPTNKTDTQRSRYDHINQKCIEDVCNKEGASEPSSRKLYKVKHGSTRIKQDEMAKNESKRKGLHTHRNDPSRQADKQQYKDYTRRIASNHVGEWHYT